MSKEEEYAFLSFVNKNLLKNPSGSEWFNCWKKLDLKCTDIKEIIEKSDSNLESDTKIPIN